MQKQLQSILLLMLIGVCACKNQTEDALQTPVKNLGPPNAQMLVRVKAVAGNVPLVFGNTYTNANGENFNVSLYKYYLSNIVLKGSSSTADYVQPGSYYLLNFTDTSTLAFQIKNIPPGNYSGITYLIGVDSTRNVSGAQTGALDPANDMFWTWSSGYVHFRLEGNSLNIPGTFMYHIGGFSGTEKAQRPAAISFPLTGLELKTKQTATLTLESDVLEIFKNPLTWDIAQTRHVSSAGTDAVRFADNYADMIRFGSITN